MIKTVGELIPVMIIASIGLLLFMPRRFGGFANGGGPIARGPATEAQRATSTPVRNFRSLFMSAPELSQGFLKTLASKYNIELTKPDSVHGSLDEIEAHLKIAPLNLHITSAGPDDS